MLKQEKFTERLLLIDRHGAKKMILNSLKEMEPISVIEKIIVPSMEKLGKMWEDNKIALAQVYMSGKIVEEIVNDIVIYSGSNHINHPKMAIAVLEDYHLLGKRVILSSMRASGYNVIDFGRISENELVDRIQSESIKIILISTLMLPSALKVLNVKSKLDELDYQIKIIVGGAPFRLDKQLYKEVGADATADSFGDTLSVINKIIEDIQ